jgi:DNA polymerase-1
LEKLVVIDGNSILNRAFYGIMGSKMLQTADGTYTNAVYGFLAIMFKLMDDINPEYMVVAFDVKHPTKRHEMYKDYKGTRKGMPDELASQMPIIKEVLEAMNIKVIEMPGYEADDILGTLAKSSEKKGIDVTLLTGDRDSFQLASDNITIRIPRTKGGKTETENFDRNKILEVYGIEPKELIEVKGLMGDTSDNIPGVPGVGEKTALNLIKEFHSIDTIYEKLENGEQVAKGKIKENLENNKDLAMLSRELGRIDVNAPIDRELSDFKLKEWDKKKVLELFKELRFNRYIERFNLESEETVVEKDIKNLFEYQEVKDASKIDEIIGEIEKQKVLYYYFEKAEEKDNTLIIKEKIKYINIYNKEKNIVYSIEFNSQKFKSIFENKEILKCGHKLKTDYILLKQNEITPQNMMFDAEIAAYILNSTVNAYSIEEIAKQCLELDITEYSEDTEVEEQTSLFDEVLPEENTSKANYKFAIYAYVIGKSKEILIEKMQEIESLDLFNNIEMPLCEILADMQYTGMCIDEKELVKYGENLKKHIEELRIDIYSLAGEEFNINSTKQLGVILFEKLNLTPSKKTKSGYSTDVDALEKIRDSHPIIDKILEYRQLVKLNSTYVEGMIPFINLKTRRIHTFFHQTVTATGRLSSTEPNLQNIPTRTELGKKLRKVFKAEDGKIFVDADYSQVELRILAHMSGDETMIDAFNTDEDIHTITASQIFKVPLEEVSKQLRSKAKAVNFGIVYGISEFGLAEQIDIKRNEAKQYIDQYLETYHGIREYMEKVVEDAKKTGYVSTEFGRRRYIQELNSKNYMVRKFGDRAAMNTPIQGTAADIMKIAMINVYNELKKRNLKSKIVLQIHDELLIETLLEEKDEVKELLKECMENAAKLSVPLKVEVEEGKNWYQAK